MYGCTGVIDKDTNSPITSKYQQVNNNVCSPVLPLLSSKVIHNIEYSKSSFKAIIVITQKLISTSISKAPRT